MLKVDAAHQQNLAYTPTVSVKTNSRDTVPLTLWENGQPLTFDPYVIVALSLKWSRAPSSGQNIESCGIINY